MALNINKIVLGGRLTSDVELRQTPQGTSVVTFAIAVNRKGKDAQADFINCQAWRQTAEIISKHFKKGSAICVTGSIQNRTWTDQQGNKRYATDIVVDEAFFVDSKSESAPNPAPVFEELDANEEDLPF